MLKNRKRIMKRKMRTVQAYTQPGLMRYSLDLSSGRKRRQ